jgi:hypothetical protein
VTQSVPTMAMHAPLKDAWHTHAKESFVISSVNKTYLEEN